MSGEEKRVPVRLEDGTVGTVPESELGQALESGGEQVTPQEFHEAKIQAEYGDASGEVAAGSLGALRGLTFGLSDAAITEFAPETREHIAALKEANPGASMAGEVAGAVAPALYTGGSSAIRGLGVIPRGASALGGLAERGTAALVGEGATGILGRAAQRGLALGARGAVEGGIYGAGHEISEAALGDYQVTAEKLLAGAKGGALAGLALGGGLGALEGAGSAALSRFMTPHEASGAVRAAESGEAKAPTKLQTILGDKADEQAWLSLSPGKRTSAIVDKTIPGGTKAVGRTLLDEEIIPTNAVAAAKATPESVLETAKDRLATWGKKIGDIRGGVPVEAPATSVGDQIRAAANEIKGGAMADMKRNLMKLSLDVDESLGVIRQDGVVLVNPKVSLEKMALERIALQQRAGFDKVNPTIGQEALQSARAKMAEHEFSLLDKAATEAGNPTALAELKAANLKYRHISHAIDALEESEGRRAGNNFFSLRDTGTALATGASGHGLLSLPAAFVSKLARERGNQISAAALHQLSGRSATLQNIERATMRTDQKIADGARAFVTKPAAPVVAGDGAKAATPLAAAFRKRAAEVADLASAPEKIAMATAQRFGDLAEHAPNVAGQMSALESQKVAFLQSKLPIGTRPMNVLQPQLSQPRVSDQEMSRFMRYAKAADDPLSVVKDLEHGKVTREGVEAVKTLYPSLFESMRTQLTQELTRTNKPLPYAKQIQLGLLFDIPAHPSLEPGFIAAMQEQWSGKRQQQGGAGAEMKQPPTRPLQLPKTATMAGAVEQIEGR